MTTMVIPETKPMVTFVEAVKGAFRKYADFTGRATRAEYWWWVLFTSIASIGFGLIDGSISSFTREFSFSPFQAVFGLATLLPGLAVTARRLHDIGKSGWWLLAWYGIPILVWSIPVILFIVGLAFAFANDEWDLLAFVPAIVASLAALAITIAILVWAIVWMARQGETGPNRFGPDPRALDEPEKPESPDIPGTA